MRRTPHGYAHCTMASAASESCRRIVTFQAQVHDDAHIGRTDRHQMFGLEHQPARSGMVEDAAVALEAGHPHRPTVR